ncbi:MAG: hypothetical protein HND58_00405 [Planctomycetota bacterium]|nr:MAG: hypothetical protein HND58_00405 [Planctomycetota bacterium]
MPQAGSSHRLPRAAQRFGDESAFDHLETGDLRGRARRVEHVVDQRIVVET